MNEKICSEKVTDCVEERMKHILELARKSQMIATKNHDILNGNMDKKSDGQPCAPPEPSGFFDRIGCTMDDIENALKMTIERAGSMLESRRASNQNFPDSPPLQNKKNGTSEELVPNSINKYQYNL